MVGIDAAVVANHRVVVRRPRAGEPGEVIDDLEPVPTLAGRDRLSARLAAYPGAVAVAETDVDDVAAVVGGVGPGECVVGAGR